MLQNLKVGQGIYAIRIYALLPPEAKSGVQAIVDYIEKEWGLRD